MAQFPALNDVLWLTDADGTSIDFGQPYASLYTDGWWTAIFEEPWTASLVPAKTSTAWEIALDRVDADLSARDPVALISASRHDLGTPLPWLPYLAQERSVDEFDSAWPEHRQRAAVQGSLALHRIKGVRAALDRAMSTIGYQVKVVEWFEVSPRRLPYTFRLSVTIDPDREWIGKDIAAMVRTANKAKNAHTKLEAIELRRNAGPANIFVGGIPRRVERIRVGQLPEIDTIRISGITHVGGVVRLVQTLRIQPKV